MTRKIEFLDTSLRDGEQTPGVNFSIKEKVAIAKQLEKWGISAIEAGFPAASPDSFAAVQEIAKVITKASVTGLARSVKSDIDACYEALKDAKHPQIHVFIATSPIHREFKLKKSKEEILEAIKEHVSYARSKFEIVEFSPEDATRTELDFLLQVVQTAVDAGASYINIPDTVGFTTPEEFGNIFKYLIDNVQTDREIIYSPHCHDDLGMAVANSLSAIKYGAGRVEGTINGIGERAVNRHHTAALEISQRFVFVGVAVVPSREDDGSVFLAVVEATVVLNSDVAVVEAKGFYIGAEIIGIGRDEHFVINPVEGISAGQIGIGAFEAVEVERRNAAPIGHVHRIRNAHIGRFNGEGGHFGVRHAVAEQQAVPSRFGSTETEATR